MMTINSITTKAGTVLVSVIIKNAWHLLSAGEQGCATLDKLPWVPAVLWRACASVRAMGEYLEGLAERTAGRLGIDIMDVLDHVTAARIG
jgi:hypothetical protein